MSWLALSFLSSTLLLPPGSHSSSMFLCLILHLFSIYFGLLVCPRKEKTKMAFLVVVSSVWVQQCRGSPMRAIVYPSFYEILTSLSEEFTCDWARAVFETPSERICLVCSSYKHERRDKGRGGACRGRELNPPCDSSDHC